MRRKNRQASDSEASAVIEQLARELPHYIDAPPNP